MFCIGHFISCIHRHTHAFVLSRTYKYIESCASQRFSPGTDSPFELVFPFGYGKSITLVGFRRHLVHMRVLSILKIQIDFSRLEQNSITISLICLFCYIRWFCFLLLPFSVRVFLCVIAINCCCFFVCLLNDTPLRISLVGF